MELLLLRRDLPQATMESAIREIMAGQVSEPVLAAFLTALRIKGETAGELAAAAQVLREHMVAIDVSPLDPLDTCGTGGDQAGTFNISTAAALVIAGCGVPVVKHGNRAVSSKSGSADVLTALGVKVDVGPETARRCLHEAGLAFCFAPRFHPAMRHVAGVRRQLGFRTLFNLLGPLCNPAKAQWQLLGVGRLELLDLLAQALANLGVGRAYLVHGEDGLDEVSLSAPTLVRRVEHGKVETLRWRPEDFGFTTQPVKSILARDAEESATRIRDILQGLSGPAREIVLANAAAGLLAAGRARTLGEGVQLAAAAVDRGEARRVLDRLVSITNRAGSES
jgi:anthranilate phosphoribosyltransferase